MYQNDEAVISSFICQMIPYIYIKVPTAFASDQQNL